MYLVILGFIALSSLLVWYLLGHDHGRKLPIGSLWTASGFGLLGIIVAGFLEVKILPKQFLLAPHSLGLGTLFMYFIGVGFLEEAAKFLPLALFIYRKPYFREHTDGIVFFAISGLTFGLGENIMYTISYGTKIGITRLLITPFFHAAATSIIGYYLVNMKITHKKTKFILAAIAIPLLHGLYDFGLSSRIAQLAVLSLMITILLTTGLFLYFMQANDLDKKALATEAIAHNNFCTHCGHQNARHTPFCEYCGNKL